MKKISEKWKTILDSIGLTGKSWFDEYANYQAEIDKNICGTIPIDTGTTLNSNSWNNFSFPVAMKVATHTIAGGGWEKSKKQILKENRINKLRKLQGKKDNIILPNDVYVDGLVSVKPLSAPTGILMYMDYIYGDTKQVKLRKYRKEKLIKIDRINKIKYINDLFEKKLIL